MARAASRATTATATPRSSRSRARLKPLGARALWICGQRHALPTTPQGHQQQRSVNVLPKSVKLTCYRHVDRVDLAGKGQRAHDANWEADHLGASANAEQRVMEDMKWLGSSSANTSTSPTKRARSRMERESLMSSQSAITPLAEAYSSPAGVGRNTLSRSPE